MKENTERILNDVAHNLRQDTGDAAKLLVLSPAQVQAKGVADLQQAKRVLHATHVLEVKTDRNGDEISVNAAIIKTDTGSPMRNYSAHFTASELHDLPGSLAGLISTALHLPHVARPIAPAAANAYNKG